MRDVAFKNRDARSARVRNRRIFGAALAASFAIAALVSYRGEGFLSSLLHQTTAEQRVHFVKTYFEQFGILGPLAYMLAVTVEVVVAPIPGAALYLPGGIVFGWLLGGTMSLLGNVFGAGIACTLSRYAFAGIDLKKKPRIREFRQSIENHGVLVVFLLRLNPLTSSDLVSYAAGTTSIPTTKVMVGTLLGMLPLCYVQAYFADELIAVFPWLIYVLVPLILAYAGLAAFLVLRARHSDEGIDDAN